MNYHNLNNINFSIILCCYNSEEFLQETLLSISNQTYKNYELIIIDDGSTDQTSNIINYFKEKNNYIRIKYYQKKNSGLSSSRNLAISKSKYDWIAIIDHDDVWLENKLETQAKEIIKNPKKKLFFSDFWILNNNIKTSRIKIFKEKDNFNTNELNLSRKKGFLNLINYGCFIGSSTVVFDKNIISQVGNFKSNYKFLCDYIFFIDVSKKFDIHCTNIILSIWRSHESQATIKRSKIYYIEMFRLYNKVSFFEKININYKIKVLKKYLRLFFSFIFNIIIIK